MQKRELEILIKQINEKTGSPQEHYIREDSGRLRAQVGHYYLSSAYGGVKLERVVNESGGCEAVSRDGYGTKKQLGTFLQGMLAGLPD